MSRPLRQTLTTLTLVVFTLVPTGYVALTAWRIHRPGHVREVEAEIGRQLGLQVALEGVRYPRPGEIVYRGLVLRQEEPRRKGLTEVARARLVCLKRGDREVTLEVDGLRLHGESPTLAMAQLGDWLQRSSRIPLDRVSLTAPTCELDLGGANLQFAIKDLVGTFQVDAASPSIRVSYRLADRDGTARCEATLSRDRQAEPVRTVLSFKTMEGPPLPARVLDFFFDAKDWLGPSARLDGELTLTQNGGKAWEADFHGNLLDIDLAILVGRWFPTHRLTGRARAAIESARWANRPGQGFGWSEMRGALTAGQGSIGRELLQALASEMKFRLSPRLARLGPDQRDLSFHALGLGFAITRDGEITLGGALGNEYAPSVVLTGQSSPLAYAPEGAANVRGLIKALVPIGDTDRGVLVPLTPESHVLMSLPVPPEIASKTSPRIGGN